jgi:hypothetical protein
MYFVQGSSVEIVGDAKVEVEFHTEKHLRMYTELWGKVPSHEKNVKCKQRGESSVLPAVYGSPNTV